MTARPRWGKAGVRLSDTESRRSEARRARSSHFRVVDEQEAYRKWDAGLLVPNRITVALDLHSLDGPEVDAACGAAEPDVDRWEAGELYPTWEQLKLLSNLTGLALRFFFLPPQESVWTSLEYHLPAPELQRQLPVARFLPGARDAKPTPIQGSLL
jgi:hypothetical protein